MKGDIQGCSSCPKGQEKYESFYSDVLRKNLVQYDYRTEEGELFSCVASSVEATRRRRDSWLIGKEIGRK
jgi:hypothetical protein